VFPRRKSAGFSSVEMLVSVGIGAALATATAPRMLGTMYSLQAGTFCNAPGRPKDASFLQEKANPAICGLECQLPVITNGGPRKLGKAPELIWRNSK
jgi:hypothetical protein